MIWDHPEKDHCRWRFGFAFLPKRIGTRRVWLSKYAYRYLTRQEKEQHDPAYGHIPLYHPTYTMWQTPDGYTCLQKSTYYAGFGSHYWHELPDDKAPLNVVPLPTSGDME